MDQEELRKRLTVAARAHIPSGAEIAERAMAKVLKERKFNGRAAWLKKNFSAFVEDVQIRAFEFYLDSQAPAADIAFREILGPLLPGKPTKDQFFTVLSHRKSPRWIRQQYCRDLNFPKTVCKCRRRFARLADSDVGTTSSRPSLS